MCSSCGTLLHKMPLDVREWTCPDCGEEHDRDINQALNILNAGLNQKSVCGTQSDSKQKRGEASSIDESMTHETARINP